MNANLAFTVTLYIDHLIIKPTNSGVYRFKLPGDVAPLRKSFHSVPWAKVFYQTGFPGEALKKAIYRAMLKISVLGVFNKNIYFSTDSAKGRTILWLAIYCNLFS